MTGTRVAAEEPIDGGSVVVEREAEEHVLLRGDEHPEVPAVTALGVLHEDCDGVDTDV